MRNALLIEADALLAEAARLLRNGQRIIETVTTQRDEARRRLEGALLLIRQARRLHYQPPLNGGVDPRCITCGGNWPCPWVLGADELLAQGLGHVEEV